jgi:hypothetical protein
MKLNPCQNLIHFVRPRGVKTTHVFKILIHIDVVEDLLFYHYPRDEMIADGKVPWRDMVWHYGLPDGDLDEDGENSFIPVTRNCGSDEPLRRQPRDDIDRDQRCPRSRDLFRESLDG